jgi:hypothetical protein
MTQTVDRAVRRLSVKAANRMTRRGFVARVGLGAAALTTGGMVAAVPSAFALCAGESVTCNTLYGKNECAGGLCQDGSWCVSSGCDFLGGCGGGATRWHDCCIKSSECACHEAGGFPTCCNGCVWGSSCSVQNGFVVRCRYHVCC